MEIVESAKKHWPYIVGGVVGLVIVFKFMGARSAASAPASGQTFDPAQFAAQAQQQLQAQQIAGNMQLAQSTLDANTQIASGKNQVAFLSAQGAVAQQIGTAAGGLIAALDLPTVTAINNQAAADAQALKSAQAIVQTGTAANVQDITDAGTAMNYVGSAVTSSERSLAGAYIGAQTAYGQASAAAASAQAATAGYQASVAIAQAQAGAKTQQVQAQAQSSSDSSMWSTAASLIPLALSFL